MGELIGGPAGRAPSSRVATRMRHATGAVVLAGAAFTAGWVSRPTVNRDDVLRAASARLCGTEALSDPDPSGSPAFDDIDGDGYGYLYLLASGERVGPIEWDEARLTATRQCAENGLAHVVDTDLDGIDWRLDLLDCEIGPHAHPSSACRP